MYVTLYHSTDAKFSTVEVKKCCLTKTIFMFNEENFYTASVFLHLNLIKIKRNLKFTFSVALVTFQVLSRAIHMSCYHIGPRSSRQLSVGQEEEDGGETYLLLQLRSL